MLLTEDGGAEGFDVGCNNVATYRTGAPGHVHEERDGVLHGLEVADVEYPHAVDAVGIGKCELLPHVLCGSDVEPLGVTWRTDVVHMIIESPAAGVLALLGGRHAAQVAPVVVAEQHEHIVGHLHALVVIVEHFLIESPHLGHVLGVTACNLLDDSTLVVDNLLQQLGVGIFAHGLVAVATHADGDDVVGILGTLDALTEEAVDDLLVGLIVPRSVLGTMAGPLLMVAGHGLMVAGADDDTHLVGQG